MQTAGNDSSHQAPSNAPMKKALHAGVIFFLELRLMIIGRSRTFVLIADNKRKDWLR